MLWFGIALAGGPREHRRLQLEFEEVLLLPRRGQGVGALGGELPGQPVPKLGMQTWLAAPLR